jgi:hypothetical protein
MNNRVLLSCVVSLSTIAIFHVVGEEETGIPLAVKLAKNPPPAEALNRFGLSYRMGFNVPVSFRNFGRFSMPNPRHNLDGAAYNFDNGYVYPDAGTPNSGTTHYWGYTGSTYNGGSQLSGNGTILMQRASSPGLSSGTSEDDPQSGVELTYNRELGRNNTFRWGLEAGFNFMNVNLADNHPITGSASLLTDAFPLLVSEGLMPPAGYQGRKNSPGVVIGVTPQSSTESAIPEIVGGSRKLDADIYGLRLGPYLEIPLSSRFSVGFSGGLSLAEINSDFQFTETIHAGSVTLPSTQGSGSHNDLLVGGYVEGNISCALNHSTGVFAGVQFQDLGQYVQSVNGRDAVLDLSKSIFVTLGISYSF